MASIEEQNSLDLLLDEEANIDVSNTRDGVSADLIKPSYPLCS